MDEAAWRVEMEQVLYESHMENSRRYRDAAELENALDQVARALALKPTSEEARELRLELQRMVGVRAGEAQTLLEDEWLAQQVHEEQRVVEARRALAEARAAEEAGDFDRAMAAYKRALFLAGEDRALRAEVDAARGGPSGR
jgi:tetratricopeptide (TPR) repeat protein